MEERGRDESGMWEPEGVERRIGSLTFAGKSMLFEPPPNLESRKLD